MNAVALLKSAVPMADADPLDFGMNIGRAVLQRASDFTGKDASLFEVIANGYEGYDFGEKARVDVTAVLGKGGFITVTDAARGMDRSDLRRFFSLHAHTVRRVGGRNLRGYNGTGKVAPFVLGRIMRVDTVRNGLRNVVVMNLDDVQRAADTNTPIKLTELAVNEPTLDANGTTITITKLHAPLKAEDIRAFREKISLELMMWMQGGEIYVNDEIVEAQQVVFDAEEIVKSPCGNFTAHIMYRQAGHPEELAYTFVMCGQNLAARENFGKEGHKYSSRVHAVIRTTDDWAAEHFNHRREKFVSESRDLRLKTADPKARELREFAVKSVSDYMKKLVEEEEKRRREEDNKLLREWEADLSRAFSAMFTFGSRGGGGGGGGGTKIVDKDKERTKREQVQGKRSKVNIEFDRKDSNVPYTIEKAARTIYVNLNNDHIKALPKEEEDPTRRQAILEITTDAYVEMVMDLQLEKEFSDEALTVEPAVVLKRYAEAAKELKAGIKSNFVERYRAFANLRSA